MIRCYRWHAPLGWAGWSYWEELGGCCEMDHHTLNLVFSTLMTGDDDGDEEDGDAYHDIADDHDDADDHDNHDDADGSPGFLQSYDRP